MSCAQYCSENCSKYTEGGGYDFIGYLDDDDEWLPEKLSRQVAKFNECSEDTALIVCGHYHYYDHKSSNGVTYTNPLKDFDGLSLLKRALYCGPTAEPLIRVKCMEAVGGFDESLPAREDWDLWIMLCEKYNVEIIYEPLWVYHSHDGEHVNGNHENHKIATERMMNKYMLYLQSNADDYYYMLNLCYNWYCNTGEWKNAFITWWKAVKLKPLNITSNLRFGVRPLFQQLISAPRRLLKSKSPELYTKLKPYYRKLRRKFLFWRSDLY